MLVSTKRIAINTMVIYIRLVVVTVVSLFATRFVLQALGASDYGLYSVVSSILVMLNCISTGMMTTTRRYINVEMGRQDGDMNKIFNVCLILHLGFALFVLTVCESVGVWYIDNYLNVPPGKMSDAHFVFQIAVVVSCLGLLNVPYQGLIEAHEKFWQTAAVDIVCAVMKLVAVCFLTDYEGNALRLYAVLMGLIMLLSFTLYRIICHCQWAAVVRFRFHRDKLLYGQILVFNNYVALGAFGALSKNQGTSVIINYFFGTLVNASMAIAYQIEMFISMVVSNVTAAAAPQVTQSYSGGETSKAVELCALINRYVILLMSLLFFTLSAGIDFILGVWLKTVPEGTALFTRWVLTACLVGSLCASLSSLIMAIGKIRWFTIGSTVIDVAYLAVGFALLSFGYPAVAIVVLLVVNKSVNILLAYFLLHRIVRLDVVRFIHVAYSNAVAVIVGGAVGLLLLDCLPWHPLVKTVTMAIVMFVLVVRIGLKTSERQKLAQIVISRLRFLHQ